MKVQVFLLFIVLLCCASCKKGTSEANKSLTQVPPVTKYGCAPSVSDADWYKKNNIAPLLEGYDVIDYPITTKDSLAQRYFNQGLILAYAFNHAEAARSFHYATKLDSLCAMAYWGFAYVLGPNYNAGMEDDNYQRAFLAIKKAKQLSATATKKEQQLIEVMALRYAEQPVSDRTDLDLTYSEALKKLYNQYPTDTEISTLYAESLMNLHPWDLNEKDGADKPWTKEIVQLLEKLIAQNPKHPGAHHLYIHAVEASTNPERSLTSAQLFDDGLVPGSGHLLHMPSHTYIRTGDYHKGTLSNIAAVEADSIYFTQCHAQGAYPLAYYPHNYHFMAATAALEGNYHYSMMGAKKVSEHVHPDIMKEPGWGTLQHYYAIPYYVAVKFEKWDDILAMQKETFDLNYLKAIRLYAEGMAHIGKNNMVQAKENLKKLKELSLDEGLKEVTIWEINSVYELVQISRLVLESKILQLEGNQNKSIDLLKVAVTIEDSLNYNEPPDWFFSIRHYLGEAQMKATDYSGAIETFKDDLKRLPNNGWSHYGLKHAYIKQGDAKNATHMEELLKSSWSTADVNLENLYDWD